MTFGLARRSASLCQEGRVGDDYITLGEAAKLLQISTRQVRRYSKGEKPSLRTQQEGGRLLYLRSDVLSLAHSFALKQSQASGSSSAPEVQSQDPAIRSELRPLKELAAEFSVNYNTLRDAAADGRLQAEKLGPIYVTSRQAVEVYLASRRRGPLLKRQGGGLK